MMRSFSSYLRRFVAALAAGFLVFASAVAVAHAETRIDVDSSYLHTNTVWNESGSPYIVTESVTVPYDVTLTIGPGVTVVGSEEIDGYNLINVENSRLIIQGTPDKPVSLSGYGGIILSYEATGTIQSANITLQNGISVLDSHLRIGSSTIMNGSQALHIASSDVAISGSQIRNNDAGIFIEPSNRPVFHPMFSGGDLPAGGQASPVSSVSITDSDITDNQGAAIENQDASSVEAMNDWWGSDNGPTLDGPNNLIGPVRYDPWKKRASETACCSSVLFIPGIEASRVYTPMRNPLGLGTTTIRAWEPLSNVFVKSLYLNADGSSIDPNIYSGDPIDNAYGLSAHDIYGSFMRFLDGLASKGTIGEWRAFGYDWRKPIAEVVAGRERKATTTLSLIDTVIAMASSSKTGKVTLVAHSNGGLVTKYLVKTLADMGKADLIDKVISVAVPYLGTPLAIPSLLYGDGTSIGYGLLLKQSVAQKLGANMASAYSLLPSATYFSKVLGPTIAYASGPATPIIDGPAQDSFISSKLNKTLMAAAESLHAIIDPFQWPAAIQRWALVGWGNDTVKSMIYAKDGSEKHTASTTLRGDSTVIVESAMYNAGTTTALDLPAISKSESKRLDHQSILSGAATQSVIENIITNKADSLDSIPGVSIGLPSNVAEASRIVVSTHSPVDLHVYDQYGNHTGIIPPPADSGVTDDVVTFYEAKIPGSSFAQNGGDGTEDDTDTEISLPADNDQKYSVSIQGNGAGEFTYEVQRFAGDELVSDTTYAGLPTTPLTVASTTVDSNPAASSLAPLTVDIDGDGTTDIVAKPGTNLGPQSFFEALKKSIISLLGPKTKQADDLSRRIDKIEALFKKDKTKKVVNKLSKLQAVLGHKRFKSLTQNDKNGIVAMIDAFLQNYEN